MPDPAELRAEVAAVAATEVADADPGRTRMRRGIGAYHSQRRPHQIIGPPPPRGPVGLARSDRVPGEVVDAIGGEEHTALEASRLGKANRDRAAPADPLVRGLGIPCGAVARPPD